MTVYLGEDEKCVTATMTATHAIVTGLTARIENGHNLSTDSFFSSSDLYDDLLIKTINHCGNVRPNKKGMPRDIGEKLKMKWDGIKTKVRDD
jgi:hypothetical protein